MNQDTLDFASDDYRPQFTDTVDYDESAAIDVSVADAPLGPRVRAVSAKSSELSDGDMRAKYRSGALQVIPFFVEAALYACSLIAAGLAQRNGYKGYDASQVLVNVFAAFGEPDADTVGSVHVEEAGRINGSIIMLVSLIVSLLYDSAAIARFFVSRFDWIDIRFSHLPDPLRFAHDLITATLKGVALLCRSGGVINVLIGLTAMQMASRAHSIYSDYKHYSLQIELAYAPPAGAPRRFFWALGSRPSLTQSLVSSLITAVVLGHFVNLARPAGAFVAAAATHIILTFSEDFARVAMCKEGVFAFIRILDNLILFWVFYAST